VTALISEAGTRRRAAACAGARDSPRNLLLLRRLKVCVQ